MNFLKHFFKKPDFVAWILSAIILFFVGLFIKLVQELTEDNKVVLLDQKILMFISRFRSHMLTSAALDITSLGSPTLIALFSFLLVALFTIKKDFLACSYVIVVNAGGAGIVYFLKSLFNRSRPDVVAPLVVVDGFSFPSGHSLSSTVFFLMLVVLSLRVVKDIKVQILNLCFAVLVIVLVSISRLYLGVHYPSDVVSGICLGASWVLSLSYFYQKLQLKKLI